MIVPRAVVVVESMAAVTIADGLLMNLSASMDSVKKYTDNGEYMYQLIKKTEEQKRTVYDRSWDDRDPGFYECGDSGCDQGGSEHR